MKALIFFFSVPLLLFAQTKVPKKPVEKVCKYGSGIEEIRESWENSLLDDLVGGTQRAMKGEDPGGEPGEIDPVATVQGGVDQGWLGGDHGDVTINQHQRDTHNRIKDQVLGTYGSMPYQTFTTAQAYAISPEPDPTATFGVSSSTGCPSTGTIVMWQQFGALEARANGDVTEDSRWKLTAQNGIPRPPHWGRMNACQKAAWQIQNNRFVIGYRQLVPKETYPKAMSIRPPDFYHYFEFEHDWCDECYDDPCERGYTPIFPTLAMLGHQDGEDVPIVWEIDYHPGEVAPYESDWETRAIRNGHQVPIFEPGAAGLTLPENMADVVEFDIICDDEDDEEGP